MTCMRPIPGDQNRQSLAVEVIDSLAQRLGRRPPGLGTIPDHSRPELNIGSRVCPLGVELGRGIETWRFAMTYPHFFGP
jgi:hypothetical protein